MIEKTRSIGQYLKLIRYLFFTKFVCKTARLIRFPLDIRGKKYIEFGHQLTTGRGCRFDVLKLKGCPAPILHFGNRVQLNDYVHICALNRIEIGDDTLIASHVYISDNSHGSYKGDEFDSSPFVAPIKREYPTAPVIIGSRVWIGEGVMILPGVNIGSGAIIGAHSIVNKDIPCNTIAVGSPAKVIKKYNQESGKWEKANLDGSFL